MVTPIVVASLVCRAVAALSTSSELVSFTGVVPTHGNEATFTQLIPDFISHPSF